MFSFLKEQIQLGERQFLSRHYFSFVSHGDDFPRNIEIYYRWLLLGS